MQLPTTPFDIVVMVVIGLSVLVALVRGAVREALSLATWAGALAVTFLGFPYARELARQTIESPLIADGVALAVVFLVPLIGFKVVAAILSDHAPGGAIGAIDKVVGAAFGAVRGAAIVCAAYLGLTIVLTPDEQPDWISGATFEPYVAQGADWLKGLVPEDVEERGRDAIDAVGERARDLRELGDAARELSSPEEPNNQ